MKIYPFRYAVGYVILLVGACLYIYAKTSSLDSQIQNLKQQISVTRALSPGRTKVEVMQWMGRPNNTFKNIIVGGKKAPSVMVYKSSIGSMQGTEDIWVVLDKNERVVTAYYPDFPQEKINLERGR